MTLVKVSITRSNKIGDSRTLCLIPLWFLKEGGAPSTITEKEVEDMQFHKILQNRGENPYAFLRSMLRQNLLGVLFLPDL